MADGDLRLPRGREGGGALDERAVDRAAAAVAARDAEADAALGAPAAAAAAAAAAADADAAPSIIRPFQVVWDELDDPFPHLQAEHEARLRRREVAIENEDDAYYEDSSDSDDETNVVDQGQEVLDPCLAASVMTDVMYTYLRYRIRDVTVHFNYHVQEDWRRRNTGRDDDHDDVYAVQFRRFVNVLECYFRIRSLHLTRANFGRGPRRHLVNNQVGNEAEDVDGFDPTLLLEDKSLRKRFGKVLPDHGSLRDLTISKSRIQPQYWQLFTQNFLHRIFMRLALESTPLSMEGCQHLQRMLQRKIRLFQLTLENCHLGADEWRVVSEGIRDNTHMHTVTLIERGVTVLPGTLLPLLQKPSFVNHLVVRAAGWSAEAFVEFVMALRTNPLVCDLTLRCDREIPKLQLVEELLTTYNYTLETVTLRPCADRDLLRRIETLLECNKRVRELGNPRHHKNLVRWYQFSSRAVWPVVLEEYGRFPTLLYHFMRMANLEDFVNQVHPAALAPPAALHMANPMQLAVAVAVAVAVAAPEPEPELEAQLAVQQGQVWPVGAVAEEAQHAASQVQSVEEAQPASPSDNKKRGHQLISD